MAGIRISPSLLRRPTGRPQRKLAAGGALAAAVVLSLTSCSNPHLPPEDASVSAVAKAYVVAAQAKDCATTKALTASDVFSWCGNPRLISYKFSGKPSVSPGHGGNRTQTCVPMELTSKGTDEAITFDGTHPWKFCFVKIKDGWRVWDQGQG